MFRELFGVLLQLTKDFSVPVGRLILKGFQFLPFLCKLFAYPLELQAYARQGFCVLQKRHCHCPDKPYK